MTAEEALERIACESLLDVAQAAESVGVSPWTIRQWVNRGHLEPVPGIAPMVFFESDVTWCRTSRRTAADAARVSSLSAAWRGVQ